MLKFLSKIILFLTIMGLFSFNAHAQDEPDFDFPQQVSKDALAQLKKAQRSGDGQMMVDALVRYSIAKGKVSQESMDTIITQIEDVKKKEKRPDYKAILNYLEASIFVSYRDAYVSRGRKNAVDEEVSSDYTEWDKAQFDAKVLELINAALADEEALKRCPITNYSKLFIDGDNMGTVYVPTLFQALCMHCKALVKYDDAEEGLDKRWVNSCTPGTPEWMYAMTETSEYYDAFKEYEKYKDNEHSALFLLKSSSTDHYIDYKGYVNRFPNSYYTPEVQNVIYNVESQSVSLSFRKHFSNTDSVKVACYYNNVNDAELRIYRIPDRFINKYGIANTKNFEIKDLELVRTHQVHCPGVVPFSKHVDETLPPLPFGRYMILGAFVNKEGEVITDKSPYNDDVLEVHNLTMFNVGGEEFPDRVFTVDTRSGAPVADVKLEITGNGRNGAQKDFDTQFTDGDGSSLIPLDKDYYNYVICASKGEDKKSTSMTVYPYSGNIPDSRTSARVFTDLNIYRPGETLKFVAILHVATTELMHPLEGESVRVILRDPNYKEIDTLEAVTDEYGRLEGEFKIPTDRMNGQFSLQFYKGKKYRDNIAYHTVNVSEYKPPTFTVSFPDARYVFYRNQPVKITGKAATYSGVPVPNAQVKLRLYRNEWSWYWRWSTTRGENIVDTVVTTDEKGEFTLELPPTAFKENEAKYWHYNYVLDAQCTNEAGESQEASHCFIVGGRRGVSLGGDKDFNNVEPLKLPLTFNSTDENEKSVECYYKVEDDDKNVLASGTISSDNPVVDLTKLPSGKYKVIVNILGDEETTSCYITLYRKGEKTSPVKDNPMWMPSDGRKVDDNNVGHITIGCAQDANIYYIATSRDKVEKQGWLKMKQGINDFSIELPSTPGGYLNIKFYSVADGYVYQNNVRLNSNVKAKALKVKVNTFRDKLISGEHEKWSFTLLDENDKPQPGAMLLEMMDKAINDISDNSWSFYPSILSKKVWTFASNSLGGYIYDKPSWSHDRLSVNSASIAEFNTYGENFFEYYGYELLGAGRGMVLYETSAAMDDMPAAVPMAKSANKSIRVRGASNGAIDEEESALQEVVMTAETGSSTVAVDEAALEKVQMRESDVKVALWQPMLVSDAQGNVSLEFDAPNFNTTWLLQALAYNRDINTDKIKREVLTNKPVMVKSSLPRFLRQGDSAQLAASLQNSTDDALDCDAIIELFNPRTDEVIKRMNFNEKIAANGTNTLKIDWEVPDTIPFVGFRVKAATGNFGDGEQVMLPVLPAISPVIETQPFYIDAATPSFTTKLPKFAKDARVTLEYCDNPVWYCVQALPTIFDDNYEIATSLAHNLFAETLAQGIAKSQPNIKEAIDYWKANEQDSTLVSMLARNSDLKIGTLLASPWVREADRQTLRMSKLNELFDEELMAAEHKRIVEGLKRLQMPDGGFTWFRHPNCESSLYTTETVLEIIGELHHLGYLKDDAELNAMIKPALAYFDKKYLISYYEHLKNNKNNHSGFSDYVYVRTLYPEIPVTGENQKMLKNCLKAMTKDWKGTSLGNKAFYAITLNRNKYQKVAKDIVESIRQFALVKPEMGMYWDNVQAGWRYLDKVAVTSTILQAMNEVDPRTAEIDNVRKWMLLMKQTNDWGSSSLAADAVYSLLSTGSKWLERNDAPTITIDGEPIEFDKVDAILGYCRKEIPATSLATLNIERNGASPAWGAIYSQFKAEMSDIKEVSIYDLSIHKEFYAYNVDGTLRKVENFKVGDKIQVRTVIKNAKDLDFVTVKDERGSCFEPLDKLSGYRYADRTYYYLEIKDSETNIFFTSLDKGTHVISYDVYVTAPGKYSVGIATAQCQYAPQIAAHSAGSIATVEP
jgi:5-hydroxyisourate hydrolase-like protein (transthyretin family)